MQGYRAPETIVPLLNLTTQLHTMQLTADPDTYQLISRKGNERLDMLNNPTCLPVAPPREDGRLSVPEHIIEGLRRCQTFTERAYFAASHGFDLKTLTYDDFSLNPSTWTSLAAANVYQSDRADIETLDQLGQLVSRPHKLRQGSSKTQKQRLKLEADMARLLEVEFPGATSTDE